MRYLLAIFTLIATVQASLTSEQKAQLPSPAPEQIDFANQIQPIIEKSCVKCHGKGRDKGGFVFETRESLLKGGNSGPAVVVGKSAESYLIELVSGLNPDEVMPEKGTKLTAREVSLLRAWIDQGLKWDGAITFAKKPALNLQPRMVAVPNGKKNENAVDRFLNANGKAVEDRVFARRVYLDIIGLIPTVEELARFEKKGGSNKRVELVKELLRRDNDYAQHWMTFWNDALRNDYRGTGYIDGGRKQISNWLYSALATNMPFDRFVAELINPRPESEGFVKGIVWRGVVNASQTPEMQAAQNISQVFMGVNLKCASCHDSFINDWTLADAYGLASVFSEKPLEMVQCDKPLGKMAAVKFIYPELGTIDANAPRAERLKRLSEVITNSGDGRLSRTIVNRLWARFFGRGLIEPVDDMEQPAWNQDLLDWLAADLVAHKYDLKRTIEVMLSSRAYQLPAVAALAENEKDFVFKGPLVRRISAEQFLDAMGQITGVWNGDPVAEINPTGEKVDDSLEFTKAKPKWIWSSTNASTKAAAEVVYFGKEFSIGEIPKQAKIVLTCDNSFELRVNSEIVAKAKDFTKPVVVVDIRKFLKPGKNSISVRAVNDPGAPGNPDADQSNPAGLIAFVWLRSDSGDVQFGTDASWTYFKGSEDELKKGFFDQSRFPSAVELGSANMAPWNLGRNLARTIAKIESSGSARAVLVNADPLMTALGRPNREQVMTQRASTATTLQALELTNGKTLADRIKAGAENLAVQKDARALANDLYLRSLGRAPTKAELATATELIGSPVQIDGVEDLLWSVAMLPEFQLIR